MNVPVLDAVPAALHWHNPAAGWKVDAGALTISAAEKTDLFHDPEGSARVDNAPRLLFKPEEHFTLSALVKVAFGATFDAGVLLLYEHADSWAKLCFEVFPQGRPGIVSVVTKGRSDDCNSVFVQSDQVYLRVAKLDGAFAFHHSTDAKFWRLGRYFSLDNPAQTLAGFSVQAPTGDSCTATFSEIRYEARKLGDIRSGE